MNEDLGEHLQLPSIAYVDEVADERDNFYADAFESGLFDKIYTLHPDPNIEDLIAKLLDLQIDALITDFNLLDAGPLNYDGEKLVSAFLAVRSDFPCFIRTSFDEAALASSDDVNRVYSKNVADDENAGRYLFRRISMQIDHHKRKVIQWQNEMAELLRLAPANRTAAVVDRILELDTKIEASFGKDVAISPRVKREILERESRLLEETERLVADIKRALDK